MTELHAQKQALEASLSQSLSVEAITGASRKLAQVDEELAREEEAWLELSGEIEVLEGA